jgi:hypothetical protein
MQTELEWRNFTRIITEDIRAIQVTGDNIHAVADYVKGEVHGPKMGRRGHIVPARIILRDAEQATRIIYMGEWVAHTDYGMAIMTDDNMKQYAEPYKGDGRDRRRPQRRD